MKKLSEFDLNELQAEIKRRQVESLEDKFRAAVELTTKNISSHIDTIYSEWDLIKKEAEITGVPVRFDLNGVKIEHYPASYFSKWKDKVHLFLVEELCNLTTAEDEYEQSNWQSSQKCW